MIGSPRESYGRLRNFIDGSFVEPDADLWLSIYDPGTGGVIGEVPVTKNVDAAVGSAEEAFRVWSRLPIYERLQYAECGEDAEGGPG
jgi:acyl-CoA reductase-like NAD-dependent aldehyde dehydrogenase